ncbi:hypothetical protein ACFQ5J_01135 [Lacticaseibacillus baoqingensis]|uniref:Prepilin-type N-terminal cleavage/methylation domain-containing protein n=1 Tax=Lacticaseibacillus baoqingensis TaxID=2486013 RepID=A0ABW4E382_9LACO|nr:hypothetical protein [Lacticaseibacillus baoqingensis]
MRPRLRYWRSGTTLIETMVAIALLAGMVLLWRPLVQAVGHPRWADQELQAVMGFEHALQKQVPAQATVTAAAGRLRVSPVSGDAFEIYLPGGGTSMIVRKIVVAKGGYQPMLDDAVKLTWQQVPHAVAFVVVFASGRSYPGVIRDG